MNNNREVNSGSHLFRPKARENSVEDSIYGRYYHGTKDQFERTKMKYSAIARDTQIDKALEKEVKTIKKDLESVKEGSNYLERYVAQMKKDQKKFMSHKPGLEASMEMLRKNPVMIRIDLVFRCIRKLKLVPDHILPGPEDKDKKLKKKSEISDAKNTRCENEMRHGGHKIVFKDGGTLVRKQEGDPYKYKGHDPKLEAKLLACYAEEQYDQDTKKLEAMTKYFPKSLQALAIAIGVRDGKITPEKANKPIVMGAAKLGEFGIRTFSQLPGVTCPGKGDCLNHCFAMSGHMNMENVGVKAYAENLGLAERDDFVGKIIKQVSRMRPNVSQNFNGQLYSHVIRIHAFGDFHNTRYVDKWKVITDYFSPKAVTARGEDPGKRAVFFYAYTKSFYMTKVKNWMKDIQSGKLKNIKIIQSYGSNYDYKIDDSLPHCKVFDNVEVLKDARANGKPYINCDHNDMVAADPKNINIGIVKHGNTPASASMCPFKQAGKCITASVCKASEMPIIHLVDQIDAPHNMTEEHLDSIKHLDPHHTLAEHARGFGKHFDYSFSQQVQSKYRIE